MQGNASKSRNNECQYLRIVSREKKKRREETFNTGISTNLPGDGTKNIQEAVKLLATIRTANPALSLNILNLAGNYRNGIPFVKREGLFFAKMQSLLILGRELIFSAHYSETVQL